LIENASVDGTLTLVILTWTGGKSLFEYFFPDNSIEAITLLDAIAIEAAGLAYSVLKTVATSMRRDNLWKAFMSNPHEGMDEPLQNDIDGLAEVASVVPVTSKLKDLLDCVLFDWTHFLSLMEQDPLFSPTWSFQHHVKARQYLFFLRTENIFLMIIINGKGELHEASLLLSPNQTLPDAGSMALQRISNYLLHFIWTSL
jgi:hypothetical protein